jgi:hypothetical protein
LQYLAAKKHESWKPTAIKTAIENRTASSAMHSGLVLEEQLLVAVL